MYYYFYDEEEALFFPFKYKLLVKERPKLETLTSSFIIVSNIAEQEEGDTVVTPKRSSFY